MLAGCTAYATRPGARCRPAWHPVRGGATTSGRDDQPAEALLRASEVTLLAGSRFAVSDAVGDIAPGSSHGFYAADTRFLSAYVLRLNGQRLEPLSAGAVGRSAGRFYATNASASELVQGALTLIRDRRLLDAGLQDELVLTNHSGHELSVLASLAFEADFLDVFEVRRLDGHRAGPPPPPVWDDDRRQLSFSHEQDHVIQATTISFSQPPDVDGATAVFAVELAPGEAWQLGVEIRPSAELHQPRDRPLVSPPARAARQRPSGPVSPDEDLWPEVPSLATPDVDLQLGYQQSVHDLRGLEMVTEGGYRVVAAGLPWFVALFGRDVLVTAYQTLPLGPELAVAALEALAAYQATEWDDFRDAEPGKFPHEVRTGRLAQLGRVPHTRYYGSVDAPPLWLIVLSETYRWTGDLDLVRALLPTAEAALTWIDRYGDADGDGFVEYVRRSSGGLDNQGWKDSWDAIRFADGRLAEGPIALVEVQGYVYDARLRMAELYAMLGDAERAAALRRQAASLRQAFETAFWLPDQGYYALALDGSKRPVDSITSNPGQALWSGIIDERRAPAVAERLLAPDLFSGWGVRSMSSQMVGYSPVAYHNGSVWPHDTALIAAGLRRYGFDNHAARLVRALVEASAGFDRRLPELFSGFERRPDDRPVAYPAANAPQAWAAGSLVLALATLMGIQPAEDHLATAPLPGAPRCRLSGVAFRGRRLTLRT